MVSQLKDNKFTTSKRGPLEKSEDIEILRFLENNLCDVSIVNLGKNNLHAVDNPGYKNY